MDSANGQVPPDSQDDAQLPIEGVEDPPVAGTGDADPPRRPRGRPRKDGTPAGSPREGTPSPKPDAASGESTTPLLLGLLLALSLYLVARARTSRPANAPVVLPQSNPAPEPGFPPEWSSSPTTTPSVEPLRT